MEKAGEPERTLYDLDANGRIKTTVIEIDLVEMFLKHNPEYREKYEAMQAEKKKGELIHFPE